MYAICMLTKCVISLQEFNVVVLLLSVTQNSVVLSPEIVANESVMPSVRVEPEKLSHLNEGQRAELIEVLDEFAACFSDKPGLCDVVTHHIVTTPDSFPGI